MPRLFVATFVLLCGPAFAADAATDGSTAATLQWQVQEMRVVKQVAPAYPAGLSASELAQDVACRASVRIDGAGLPFHVNVEGCPEAYRLETSQAVSAWRWEPLGGSTERRVTLTVRFDGKPVSPSGPASGTTVNPIPAPVGPVGALGTTRPVLPPVPAPVSAGKASANLVPRSASSSAQGDGEGTQRVTCSGTIHRNRIGQASRVDVGACPPELEEATLQVLKILSKTDAPRAPRGTERKRVQPVQVAYTIGEV